MLTRPTPTTQSTRLCHLSTTGGDGVPHLSLMRFTYLRGALRSNLLALVFGVRPADLNHTVGLCLKWPFVPPTKHKKRRRPSS